MSKWEKIKEKCSFENDELIQVSMVDDYVKDLEQQLAQERDANRWIPVSERLPDATDKKARNRYYLVKDNRGIVELCRLNVGGFYTLLHGEFHRYFYKAVEWKLIN